MGALSKAFGERSMSDPRFRRNVALICALQCLGGWVLLQFVDPDFGKQAPIDLKELSIAAEQTIRFVFTFTLALSALAYSSWVVACVLRVVLAASVPPPQRLVREDRAALALSVGAGVIAMWLMIQLYTGGG